MEYLARMTFAKTLMASSVLFAIACAGQESSPLVPSPPEPPTAGPVDLASAPPAPVAVHAPKAPVLLEEYFKIGRVRGVFFSYDEKLVAYLYSEGEKSESRLDVWVMSVVGGVVCQIT